MKKLFLIILSFVGCLTYSCKNTSTENIEPYAGEYPFESRIWKITADPPYAIKDTTVSLEITLQPKFTGTGWSSVSFVARENSPSLLVYPYSDTLTTDKNFRKRTNFQAGVTQKEIWKFKILYDADVYTLVIDAAYDSIYVQDSSKMYSIISPEVREIKWIQGGGPAQVIELKRP
ncbi:MAG: hypothetical protein GXX85_13150 [Ignavibacteria bacterium]|nr:hypothetical protein [Ignavibacteria bacterium]